jgi:transcriptional antiterminator Rof (Rho-off)
MVTQTMVQPSSWVESSIKISKVRNLNLFKFTDELQSRLDDLSERKKSESLTAEEEAELVEILELDRIFTLLNAKVIAVKG